MGVDSPGRLPPALTQVCWHTGTPGGAPVHEGVDSGRSQCVATRSFSPTNPRRPIHSSIAASEAAVCLGLT